MQVWEAETETEGMRLLRLLIFRAYQMCASKPILYGNLVDLRPLLRQSVCPEHESRRAKKPKKPGGQMEMLLPIGGKNPAQRADHDCPCSR